MRPDQLKPLAAALVDPIRAAVAALGSNPAAADIERVRDQLAAADTALSDRAEVFEDARTDLADLEADLDEIDPALEDDAEDE